MQHIQAVIQGVDLGAAGFVAKQLTERTLGGSQALAGVAVGGVDALFQCVVITAEQRLDAILFGAQPDAFGAGQAGSEVGQAGVAAPGFSLIGLRLAFALAAEWRAEFLL